MIKYVAKFNIIFLILLFFCVFGLSENLWAANHYVLAGATGANNGTDWTNAYTALPSTLTRGDTYYVADGTYSSYTFDDTESGSTLITIKKAIIADHGTETGWLDAYGDGQAVFANVITFATGYYIIDGNGTHTIPSNNTNDYGIKINANSTGNTSGIVRIGTVSGAVSYITLRYVHIYNTYAGLHTGVQDTSNATVAVRWYPSVENQYTKIQNCFIENSGKDGLQISRSDYILIEKSYLRRLAQLLPGSPDNHGQTVQMAWSTSNLVFRWNVWDGNEGQAMLLFGDGGQTFNNFRFYGNVILSKYGTTETAGFNSSGGITSDAEVDTFNTWLFYNNTIVNQRGSYAWDGSTYTTFQFNAGGTYNNMYRYNNIFYNSETSNFSRATADGYNAFGAYGSAVGTNAQTGLDSSIFTNYASDDFRLVSATNAGLTLTSQSWWNNTPDSFFGQLDYDTDIFGNVRGADGIWDRGAYEYVNIRPSAPSGLTIH